MSDKKQSETEQPRQQNKVWSWGKWIIMMVLGGFSLFICWLYLSPEFICWLRLFPKQWATNNHIWLQLYLGALAVTGGLVLCKPQIITSSSEKYFITRVLTTGITGGAFALLLPIAVKSTTTGVGGLRHSILLATGGLLAILTLGETRRKNDIDKRKNEQEKEKNDKDHRRQVRAERRERYTKAVEQLGDEKAPIRMGGVYTLVGLVDEWLKDESIKKYEDRLKEGQVIVNNLCAYIRSPFTLATRYDELDKDSPTSDGVYKDIQQKFYTDKADFKAEADVRLSIIKEIHDRLQGPDKNTPGAWSDFEYDFSGSTFFYSVDLTNSYYRSRVSFSNSYYYKKANFSGSFYDSRASFCGSIYKKKVIFSSSKAHSIYKRKADFSGSEYHRKADFRGSIYKKKVIFSSSKAHSIYKRKADFSGSEYHRKADFRGSIYKKKVTFSNLKFMSIYDKPQVVISDSDYNIYTLLGISDLCSTYHGTADFSGSKYQRKADFRGSIYKKDAIFSTEHLRSTYRSAADFSGSTYGKLANFSYSTYEDDAIVSANQYRSTYHGTADFRGSTYGKLAKFSYSTYKGNAIFSSGYLNNNNNNIVDTIRDFLSAERHRSTYHGTADFRGSTYYGWTDFSVSTYEKDVTFSTPYSRSTYWGRADFGGSTYWAGADFSHSTYEEDVIFSTSNIDPTYTDRKGFLVSSSNFRSTYWGRADFGGSTYWGLANFSDSTYEDETDFSGSIFYQEVYFGEDGDNSSFSRFTDCAPQFYDETNRKNTLFGSPDNDFSVENGRGYPIYRNLQSLPLGCDFLTAEQKEYLEDKFQEIDETKNKFLKVKDPKEKAELSKNLQAFNEELYEWREEATTVKVEDGTIENAES